MILDVGMHTSGTTIPNDPNSRIWRYMKYEHLEDLLSNHRLHFARADTVDDINEGQLPESIRQLALTILPEIYKNSGYSVEQLLEKEEKGLQQYKRAIFLNCWHLDNDETKERWQNHKDREIAIQSTYLKLELASYEKKRKRYEVSLVNYIDHANDYVSQQHPFTIYLQKALKYGYEREIRAISYNPHLSDNEDVFIAVNLEPLLEQIVISPNVNEHVRSHIRAMTARYDLNIPVINSRFT